MVFAGLLVALWVWKCTMMVVFQNKIIYMPGLPPNARREEIADYSGYCGSIGWKAYSTQAADGTRLALCVASVGGEVSEVAKNEAIPLYILYFQGGQLKRPWYPAEG